MAIPNTPWDLTVTRQSDRQHTIGWTVTTPAGKEIDSFLIQRWSRSRDDWQPVKVLPGTARSWVDGTTVPGDWYQWRVVARNASGNAAPAATVEVPTSQRPPTNVTLQRAASGALLASWSREAQYVPRQDVQATSDGGKTWIDAVIGLPDSAASASLPDLDPTLAWQVRVQVVINTPVTGWLITTSTPSLRVGPLQRPGAPTVGPIGVQPTQPGPLIRWRHTTLDGSSQQAAQVRVRRAGESTWLITADVAGAAQEWRDTATAYASGEYVVEVRTRGAHASWSDWSAALTVRVVEPPLVAYTAPGATWPSNRLAAVITYADPQDAEMIGWRRTLRDGAGATLEVATGDGPQLTHTFATVLTNEASYSVEVVAVSAWGVESVDPPRPFDVEFLSPATPTLAAEWLEDEGAVTLTATWPAGATPTTAGRFERSTDGATWQPVPGAALPATARDEQAPLGATVRYRAVAVSDLGVEAYSAPADVATASGTVWLVGEDHTTVRLRLEPTLSVDMGADATLEVYLGRETPEAHHGPERPVRVAVSATLVGDDLEQDFAGLHGQDVFYRDPTGRAWWAAVTGLAVTQSRNDLAQIALTVEKVTHGAA